MCSQNQVIVLVLLISTISIQGNLLEDKNESLSQIEVQEYMNTTAVKCGVPNDKIGYLYDFNLNETTVQELKCAIGCLMKNFELITDKNEFNKKGLESLIELIDDNWESLIPNENGGVEWYTCDTDEFENKCSTRKAENECEHGLNFFNCIKSICETNEGKEEEEANPDESKEEPPAY